MPTPTDRGVGNKKDDTYDNLKDKFKKTNTLISTLDGMAKQFYDNPESALAIGGGVQFIDSVIKNIDAAGNMLSGKEYETMKDKGFISSDGTDYSTILEDVSTNTGISASRVRDLAYLFAAARGQEGRGLSDKDYENALSIVSGGVGAKGKIAVLNDVAKRMYGEAIGDLNFEISNLPSNADVEPFERLRSSLSTFQNPYSINSQEIIQNTETDDPLKIR